MKTKLRGLQIFCQYLVYFIQVYFNYYVGFLVFVSADETDFSETTEESEGRRAWRRRMTKVI